MLHPSRHLHSRRDNLQGFWREHLGYTHGLLVVGRFYENVEGPDGRNRVVQFQPSDREPMLVACLWSRWTNPAGEQPDLLSFAAITDEPEPEVAALGHDRTIIRIKPEHIDAWLNPDPANLQALQAILEDKRHPFTMSSSLPLDQPTAQCEIANMPSRSAYRVRLSAPNSPASLRPKA